MISVPDDLINYIYDIITADEDEDFKKINANADAYKPTVLLNESIPSFIHCMGKFRCIIKVIPTDPFVLEQGKDAKLYTKKELYYQFDKLDYFLEMMKTGKYSIIAFGI